MTDSLIRRADLWKAWGRLIKRMRRAYWEGDTEVWFACARKVREVRTRYHGMRNGG